jgi:hypothetical protein
MASRVLSVLLVMMALGAFLCAVYLYVRPPAEEPALVVEEPARVYNDLVAGHSREIEFRIHNRTGQTLRVVGADGGGGGGACLF